MRLPRHIPQLDVLRGVAVLTVTLYHAMEIVPHLPLKPVFGSGYVGVDLFFVLSGFLITGILLRTKDTKGFFINFYARRALRIWPLYYVLLLATFVALPAIDPELKAQIFTKAHPWQSYFFFLQNLLVHGASFDSVRVLWSLAIEEQFYLFWPMVIFLAPKRSLKALTVAMLLFSLAMRWSVQYGLVPAVDMYTNTSTRLDGLALGALLAVWIPEASSRLVKLAGVVALALALPVTIALGYNKPGHWSFYSLVSLCCAAIVCILLGFETLPEMKFLKYSGKISYALYLVHLPVFSIMNLPAFRRMPIYHSSFRGDFLLLLTALAACYALSAISWSLFEKRILGLKTRFENTPNPEVSEAALPLTS